MKAQFSNQLLTSFALWLDNRLTDDGEGFVNESVILYRQIDTSKTGYYWASPFKSWIYDSAITGANIPTGFYNAAGAFITKTSGIGFDFINGRAFSLSDFGDTLSGVIARKEYNVYLSNEEEVDLFLQQVYQQDKNINYDSTGIAPYKFAAPCVILTNTSKENIPYAFGGLDQSIQTLRAFVINDNNYSAEAVDSLLVDSARKHFALISDEDIPLNINNDLKTGYYNFDSLNISPDVFISKVTSVKLNEKSNNNSDFTITINDFQVEVLRYPRI